MMRFPSTDLPLVVATGKSSVIIPLRLVNTMASIVFVILLLCATFCAADDITSPSLTSSKCSSAEEALAKYIQTQTFFTEAQLEKEKIQEKMFIKQTEFFAAQRDFFQVKQKSKNESLAEVGGLLGALELLTAAMQSNLTSEEIDDMVNSHFDKKREERKDVQPTESASQHTVEKRLALMEEEMNQMRISFQSVGILQGIIKELLHDMAVMSEKIVTLEQTVSRQESAATTSSREPGVSGPSRVDQPPVRIPLPPLPKASCSLPYIAVGQECVFLSKEVNKWRQARLQCFMAKGDLFVPSPLELIEFRLQPQWRNLADPHPALLDFLEQWRRESGTDTLVIWFGGADQDFDGRVEWVTGEQVTYADSYEDLGVDNSGRCLMLLLDSSGRWKVATLACSGQKKYLCKKK